MRSPRDRARCARQSCRCRRSGCQPCRSRCPADVRYAGSMVDSAMRTIHSGVAIVGGGLVGTWTAYFLRKRGHSVTVIEKGAVGSQASGVNFGNVRLEGRHPTEFRLALRAIEQWERIEELIGQRCEFTPCGHSYIALDPNELARLERYHREGTAGGLEIELLGANQVRQRFPYLGPDVCGATWSKRDGTANPRLVTPAVARAARAAGGRRAGPRDAGRDLPNQGGVRGGGGRGALAVPRGARVFSRDSPRGQLGGGRGHENRRVLQQRADPCSDKGGEPVDS